MTPSDELPPQDALPHSPDWPEHPEIESRETRNLLLLALHQIVLRVGWIFKTESVIMPAFLDQVAGAGWIRGLLPVLGRLGQGVPPLFAANYLRALPRKRRALAALATAMGLPFLGLAIAWFVIGSENGGWMPALFLSLYFLFFVLYGLYLVSFGTVQGKLIRPTRRGQLITLSTFWGAIPATLIAVWLMPDWLDAPSPCWGAIFTFVGVCFCLSGLLALLLVEVRNGTADYPTKQPGTLAESLHVLRADADLRRLLGVAILFASSLVILPHYQALARARLGLSGVDLMVWVVTQNAAVAIFSLFVGPLADRRGYRMVLRLLVFGSGVAPAFAIALTRLPNGWGAGLFWLVYVPLGVTPLVPRTLLNYALEICEPAAHARYQSIVTLGIALPFLLSPLAGWLIDVVGFESVFLFMILLALASGCLTFRLNEPRHRPQGADAQTLAGELDG